MIISTVLGSLWYLLSTKDFWPFYLLAASVYRRAGTGARKQETFVQKEVATINYGILEK